MYEKCLYLNFTHLLLADVQAHTELCCHEGGLDEVVKELLEMLFLPGLLIPIRQVQSIRTVDNGNIARVRERIRRLLHNDAIQQVKYCKR